MNKKRKIVILDGSAFNPGDLSWDSFSRFGEVIYYPQSKSEEVIERIGDAEMVITNKVVIDKTIIKACPSIKYIGLLSTGYNVIDLDAANEYGITVTNVPDYSSHAVAQLVFAFILEMANKVTVHDASVHAGEWITCPNFCYWKSPLTELRDKTIGIIGLGSIGQHVMRIANAFDMNVLYNSRTRKEQFEHEKCHYASMDELFEKSDIITLHCPLFENTKDLINTSSIEKMKKSVWIINTARGGCINEADLVKALNEERIAYAGLDVIDTEPMKEDCILLKAKNLIITPHIAWASYETRLRLMGIAVKNLENYLNGESSNVVNRPHGQ